MKKLFIVAVLAIGIISCDQDKGPYYEPLPPDSVPDTISFAADIQPLFDANCISCHNQSHPKLNLLACCSHDQLWNSGFTAPYIDTANPSSSLLINYLNGVPALMPPTGSLPQQDIDLILEWIEQGAENN